MIGRIDPQKGFDLLADGTPDLLAAGARVIVQGSGHASLADPFRALAAAHPAQVALIERFDRDMARRIYAGADLFLMPSRFEPCGQGQMIALRYGTPPVVRRTGGLADSVVDVDEHPAAGTGFVFDEATPAALVAAVERAAARRASDPAAWASLRDRGMAVDFRWDTGSAPRYLEAYRRAIALRRGDAYESGSVPIHPAGTRARRGGQPGGPDAQAVRRPGHQPARPARDPRRADGRSRRGPAGDRRWRDRRARAHDHDHGRRRRGARGARGAAAGRTSRASRSSPKSTTDRAAWPSSRASSPTRASTSTATCSSAAGATAPRSRSWSTIPRRRGPSSSGADPETTVGIRAVTPGNGRALRDRYYWRRARTR